MTKLLVLFILKVIDCFCTTTKTLLMIRNKDLLSSLFMAISQFFYLTILIKITKSNSLAGILIVCLGAFIGSYIPKLIMRHRDKDKVWSYEILPNNIKQSQQIADKLRENQLEVYTIKSYNFSIDKILTIKVFSNTKDESDLIENIIPNNVPFHVTELKKCLNLE